MSALSVQEVRIRLEGRLELLELAAPRYGELEQLLKGAWRRHAIEQRPLIESLLAQEDTVLAALDQVTRLAEREGLDPGSQPQQLALELKARRARLVRKLADKLRPVLRATPTSLKDGLEKLHHLSQTVRLPGPDELVVLQGTAARSTPLWLLTLVPTLAALAAYGGLAAAGVLVSMICLGLAVLPLGRYVLLADRLLWIPYRGEPLEFPHADQSAEGIELFRQNTGMRIDGKVRLELPVVTAPLRFAALLMLYRGGPLRGVARPPSGTAMILPAVAAPGQWQSALGRPAGPVQREGTVLLHTEGIAFLPQGSAPELLQRLVRRERPVPIGEEFLLEQLTRLPPEQLRDALELATGIHGALSQPAAEVRAERSTTPTERLRLTVGDTQLELQIGAVDRVALKTLFPWTVEKSRQVP